MGQFTFAQTSPLFNVTFALIPYWNPFFQVSIVAYSTALSYMKMLYFCHMHTLGPFTRQPRPNLSLARTGAFTSNYRTDLTLKFYIIISPYVSSVCCPSTPKLCIPDGRWCKQCKLGCEPRSAQPYYKAEPSVACFRPGTAYCKSTILCSAPKCLKV